MAGSSETEPWSEELYRRVDQLQDELDRTRAWCIGLEGHLAGVIVFLQALGFPGEFQ